MNHDPKEILAAQRAKAREALYQLLKVPGALKLIPGHQKRVGLLLQYGCIDKATAVAFEKFPPEQQRQYRDLLPEEARPLFDLYTPPRLKPTVGIPAWYYEQVDVVRIEELERTGGRLAAHGADGSIVSGYPESLFTRLTEWQFSGPVPPDSPDVLSNRDRDGEG